MFYVHYLLRVGCCALVDVCCLMYVVVNRVLFVVCCLLYGVRVFAFCGLLCNVCACDCCLLYVVC